MSATVTEQVALRPSFTFPGGIWHRLALTDPTAIDRRVAAIVSAMLGGTDALAPQRARLRQELAATVHATAAGGALELFVAEQVTSGMPVTATLAVHGPSPRLSPAVGTDGAAVMDVFLEGRGLAGVPGTAEARFRAGEGEAFREILPTSAVEGTPLVAVRFWLTVPGTKSVLPVQFASPFVDLAAPLVTLFTAIVASVSWPAPPERGPST